jgi:hypothetical protein
MAKQTFQMHLYAKESTDYDKDFNEVRSVRFALNPYDDADYMGCYVGPVACEVEVPDHFDMRAAMLAQKQAELEKVRAEFTNRITQIQREISQLTAIEAA